MPLRDGGFSWTARSHLFFIGVAGLLRRPFHTNSQTARAGATRAPSPFLSDRAFDFSLLAWVSGSDAHLPGGHTPDLGSGLQGARLIMTTSSSSCSLARWKPQLGSLLAVDQEHSQGRPEASCWEDRNTFIVGSVAFLRPEVFPLMATVDVLVASFSPGNETVLATQRCATSHGLMD